MNTGLQKIVAASFLVLALPAWAGHDSHRYGDGRYVYAKVVNAQPVFEIVRVPERYQVDYDKLREDLGSVGGALDTFTEKLIRNIAAAQKQE